VDWMERSWLGSLVSCLVLAGLFAMAYFVGVPWAADLVASSISMQQEREIGRKAAAARFGKQPSCLPLARQREVETSFQELSRGLPLAAHYRLVFDGAQYANAFAFPGGTVIVTDGLLEKCSVDEVAAILAHEIGHVEHRHGLRQGFRSSALALLLGTLASEMGSVSLSTSGLPGLIANTRYSRELEEEADAFAIALLLAHKRQPELLGKCLQRISPSADEPGPWHFLSTHPHTAARAKRASAASSTARAR
ncbi:MAG TPA: M48 family metallopeptidase, partial [Polyangiaceae bacterium]|nr:M48 family metallopeptidase [Polyangiaceae bacterium]